MTHTLIGYARCSTDKQDLTAQRQILESLGVVAPDRIYTDHGFTDIIKLRTREGLAVARAKGKLRGKKPNQNYLVE